MVDVWEWARDCGGNGKRECDWWIGDRVGSLSTIGGLVAGLSR
jgi:hypothetical protein